MNTVRDTENSVQRGEKTIFAGPGKLHRCLANKDGMAKMSGR